MSALETCKRFSVSITFFAAGIVSIGFSSWQYQTSDGGNTWTGNWDDDCKSYPLDILRPVRVKPSGQSNYSYCGYGDGPTGYRLSIACVMVLFSIAFFFNIFETRPRLLNAIYWSFYSLWFLAAGLDIMALSNGQASCQDGFPSSYTCDNSVYGTTIAIDVCICAAVAVFIYFHGKAAPAAVGGAGNAV